MMEGFYDRVLHIDLSRRSFEEERIEDEIYSRLLGGIGHATIATTLDIYSHVLPGLQEAAAGRFDEGLAFTPSFDGPERGCQQGWLAKC